MALQLRRGTNAERLQITPQQGELIFVTDYLAVNITGTTIASNVITFSASHGITELNTKLLYQGATQLGLTQGTVYYVKSIPAVNTLTLSTTSGGTTLTLTNGTALSLVFNKSPKNAQGTPVGSVSPLWIGDGITIGGVSAQVSVLDDLLDVTLTSLQEGQTLYYDATSGQWKNTGIFTIDDTNGSTNVNITTTDFNLLTRTNTNTDLMSPIFEARSITTSLPVAGFGSSINFSANNLANEVEQLGVVGFSYNDLTATQEDAAFIVKMMKNGVTPLSPVSNFNNQLTVDSTGNIYAGKDLFLNKDRESSQTSIYFRHPTTDGSISWQGTAHFLSGDLVINGGTDNQVVIDTPAGGTGIANVFNNVIGTVNMGNGVTTELNLGNLALGTRTQIKSPQVDLVGDILVGGGDIKTGVYNSQTGAFTSQQTAISMSGIDVTVGGELKVTGNKIKSSNADALTFSSSDVTVVGDLYVTGSGNVSDIVAGKTTASLFPTTPTVNIGTLVGGSTNNTVVNIGGTNSTTNINHNAVIAGDLAVNGSNSDNAWATISTTNTQAEIFPFTATSIHMGYDATEIIMGALDSGITTIRNDLAVNGGDITTTKSTANIYNNDGIGVINIGNGATTQVNIGNYGTGTVNIKSQSMLQNDLAGVSKTFNLFNSITETLNVGGAATAVNIGATTGTTTIRNNAVVTGNLTVNGTTTTVNSTTLTVDDKNIELGSVATPTDITASGGGITLKGATDKTIIWNNSTDGFEINQAVKTTGRINVADKTFLYANTGDIRVGNDVYVGGNFIKLREAQTGTPDVGNTSSIVVERGDLTNAALSFYESDDTWYFTNNAKIENNFSVIGATTLYGNTTIGDNSADTVTVNGITSFTGGNNTTAGLNTTGAISVGGNIYGYGNYGIFVNGSTLLLNNNTTGSPTKDAEISVARGSSTSAKILWNESTDTWEFTNDVKTAGDITIGGNDIKSSTGATALTLSGSDVTIAGDITIGGNDIKSSTGATALTLSGSDVTIAGDITIGGNDIKRSDGATMLTFQGTDLTTFAGSIKLGGNGSGTKAIYVDFDGNGTNENVLAFSSSPSIYGTSYLAKMNTNVNLGIGVSYVFIDNMVEINTSSITTTQNSSYAVLDYFDKAVYRSAKYVLQISNGTAHQMWEGMVIHDGTNIYMTAYGDLRTNGELAHMSVGFNATTGYPELRVQAVNATQTKFKATKTYIAV